METSKRESFNKEDIKKKISFSIGLPLFYSAKIINDIIQILILNLKLNKKLKIKNFGVFSLKEKNKRIGRNPKNKIKYEVLERNVIIFKAAEELKRKLNRDAKK